MNTKVKTVTVPDSTLFTLPLFLFTGLSIYIYIYMAPNLFYNSNCACVERHVSQIAVCSAFALFADGADALVCSDWL